MKNIVATASWIVAESRNKDNAKAVFDVTPRDSDAELALDLEEALSEASDQAEETEARCRCYRSKSV